MELKIGTTQTQNKHTPRVFLAAILQFLYSSSLFLYLIEKKLCMMIIIVIYFIDMLLSDSYLGRCNASGKWIWNVEPFSEWNV